MNNYFDKVYVLSLRKETERRNKINERLKSINLEFEFFDAYDGSIMKNVWENLNNQFITTPNYLACQLSHISIYNDAIFNNYQRILILEDDAVPKKDINELFEKIKPQIPEYYDLLYLGYIPLDDDRSCWDYRVMNNRFITENIFNSKNLWGLYSYSISNKMMREMVDLYNNELPMELDRYYVENHKEYYGILPQLFCHDNGVSSNAGLMDYSSVRKSIHHQYPIEDYF